MEITDCRSCHAPVIWVITENGKKVQVDADPADDERGYVLIEQPDGSLLAVWHKKAAESGAEPDAELYHFHFATCPNAEKHRRTAGATFLAVLAFGVWSLAVMLGGIEVGSRVARSTVPTHAEISEAWVTIAVLNARLERSHSALDSVQTWIHRGRPAAEWPTFEKVADGDR